MVVIRGIEHDLRAALLNCVLFPTQLGCPVVSAPIGEHEGLPFGLQLFGRAFSEPLLLAPAKACETRLPDPSVTCRANP
ncbi:MAG TPA: hypothetical protein VIX82_03665 [Solirubrobacteraceae bacterium]